MTMSHGTATESTYGAPRLFSYSPPLGGSGLLPPLPKFSSRSHSTVLGDLTFGGVSSSPSPPPRATPTPPAAELSASLPTVDSLVVLQRILPSHPDETYLPWIRDVFFLVERLSPTNPQEHCMIADPQLRSLASAATSALLRILSGPGPHPPEAYHLRGLLHANGAMLELVPRNPRNAFSDFEEAARNGCAKSWFKLGRDYETVNDLARARDCFDRGLNANSGSCIYRLGMAKLLGQLGFIPSADEALPLLYRAATLSSIENPHPAYVWALLLLGEFSQVKVEERAMYKYLPPAASLLDEARVYMERAAYNGFTPAQLKLGQAYEYAIPPYMFDPLKSMQYYSFASQQGEPEADMALSKWFLCGWESAFEKDEKLAVLFAEKAARSGLPTAEFALGYYAEVGIGCPKDIELSRQWYTKAFQHGNAEAGTRLAALSQAAPQALSRTEHDQIANDKLVRRRTQAHNDAAASGRVAEIRRENSIKVVKQIEAQAGSPTIRYTLSDQASFFAPSPLPPPPPPPTITAPVAEAQDLDPAPPRTTTPTPLLPEQTARIRHSKSQPQLQKQQQSPPQSYSNLPPLPRGAYLPPPTLHQPSHQRHGSLPVVPVSPSPSPSPRPHPHPQPPSYHRHTTDPALFTLNVPSEDAHGHLSLSSSSSSSSSSPAPLQRHSQLPVRRRVLSGFSGFSGPRRTPSPLANTNTLASTPAPTPAPAPVPAPTPAPAPVANVIPAPAGIPGIHPDAIRSQIQHQRKYSGQGPATFAEMGIQAGKAPEKECKIM